MSIKRVLYLLVFLLFFCDYTAFTQVITKIPEGPSLTVKDTTSLDSILVTVILRHHQDKNLLEIRRKLETNGFWDLFPPKEARILSWNIVIGIGHVITLRIPASSVRALNLAVENGAWGAFNTDIELTYDYLPIYQEFIDKRKEYLEENKSKN